jgi:hypothetical protein
LASVEFSLEENKISSKENNFSSEEIFVLSEEISLILKEKQNPGSQRTIISRVKNHYSPVNQHSARRIADRCPCSLGKSQNAQATDWR